MPASHFKLLKSLGDLLWGVIQPHFFEEVLNRFNFFCH